MTTWFLAILTVLGLLFAVGAVCLVFMGFIRWLFERSVR